MIKVMNVKISDVENVGCNNGVSTPVKITLSNGKVYNGNTCRCCRGCHGTWNVPDVGTMFDSLKRFEEFL